MRSASRFRRLALMSGALGVAACSMANGPGDGYDAGSAEDLLSAEGQWVIVEEQRDPSPVEKHMQSRGKVSPAQMSKSRDYTQSASAMHVNEDMHFRVLRLERQMNQVRHDLSQIMPKIMEMPESAAAAPAPEPKPAVKAAPKAAVKKAAPKAKVITGGPLRVTGVRTGVHPGKYRFVMDVSGAPEFSYELDNAEKILLVELPGTGWAAAAQKTLGGNPVVSGYSAQEDGDKTLLVISLKGPVKVTMAQAFKPNNVYGHRIVMDIAPE